jgi:environmental stress-induced protein Ves
MLAEIDPVALAVWAETAIVTPGPFSDVAGCDRTQVVVHREGLVLELPDREIEVRPPRSPVRFRGEDHITSRFESGPVQAVNLIADRARFELTLSCWLPARNASAVEGRTSFMPPILGPASRSAKRSTPSHQITLQLDVMDGAEVTCVAGASLLVASICCLRTINT